MVDIGVKEMKGIFFFFYNNNSVRASKIKSDNYSLFCSRRILDVSIGTKEEVNISDRKIWFEVFDTILKDSTNKLTYTTVNFLSALISLKAKIHVDKWNVMDICLISSC